MTITGRELVLAGMSLVALATAATIIYTQRAAQPLTPAERALREREVLRRTYSLLIDRLCQLDEPEPCGAPKPYCRKRELMRNQVKKRCAEVLPKLMAAYKLEKDLREARRI